MRWRWLAVALALTACGGGGQPSATTPSTTAADPPSLAAPDPPAVQTETTEGIWSGATFSTTPGYPGFIVDANGVFWSESINWICANNAGMTGTLSTVGPVGEGGLDNAICSGGFGDSFQITSATVSSGTLSLTGQVNGAWCYSAITNGFSYCYSPVQPLNWIFDWAENYTLEAAVTPVPVSALAGTYTTIAYDVLTINPDGTFTIDDDSSAAPIGDNQTNCVFTGSITILDQTQNIYSLTATLSSAVAGAPCNNAGDIAVGVFTVLPTGQLAGGLGNAHGAFVTFDTGET